MSVAASHAVFERIDRDAARAIGQQLFTVTAFHASTMEVERVYSSNAAAYPGGGRKAKRDTEFSRRILVAGEPVVCEGDDAIERFFDDHLLIRSLGLHSSLNAPVKDGGTCVGVLNFLMAATDVTEQQVAAACAFAADVETIAALKNC
jgi:transcriptional regulator with GAF, ATPase, and Fis domain